MQILDEIQKFEKEFVKAGELAVEMRKDLTSRQKHKSGWAEIDIVTSADLAVQEYILSRLAKSELKNCELIAEEDTNSVDLFAKKSEYVLTLDPIDGTKIYSEGKKMFSVVVTIHDKKEPIYTFCYYPAVKWGVKIVGDKLKYIGKKPTIGLHRNLPKKIIDYWDRPGKLGPAKTDPKVYKQLLREGYTFVDGDHVSTETGLKTPFLLGVVSGTFIENGSAVDSLTEYHLAKALKIRIFGKLDLSKPAPSPRGNYLCYRGYYYAVRQSSTRTPG